MKHLGDCRILIVLHLETEAGCDYWAGMARPDKVQYATRVQNGEDVVGVAAEIDSEATSALDLANLNGSRTREPNTERNNKGRIGQ